MASDPLALVSGGLFSSLSGLTQGLLESELHPRTVIRKHVTDKIKGNSLAQQRIFASRYMPMDGEKLAAVGPIVLVYTLDDPVDDEPFQLSPRIDQRRLQLQVEILASSALEDQQDVLDAISLAVERIVLLDETQGGNAVESVLLDTRFNVAADGEYPFASNVLEFEIAYQVSAEDPIASTDTLDDIHADWDLGPEPDGTPEAQDHVHFEEA